MDPRIAGTVLLGDNRWRHHVCDAAAASCGGADRAFDAITPAAMCRVLFGSSALNVPDEGSVSETLQLGDCDAIHEPDCRAAAAVVQENIAVPVAVVVAHLGDRADQRSVSDRAAAQPRAVRQTAVSPLLVRHSKSVLPSPLKSPAEQLVKVLPDDQLDLREFACQRHASLLKGTQSPARSAGEDAWRHIGNLVAPMIPANAPNILPTQDMLPPKRETF
jgi:hypothetical protein